MKSSTRESKRDEKSSSDPLHNELESILANRIDEDYIASVTGIKDLDRIEYIALQIDTSLQSVFDLIDLLPNMKHLVLDNSVIGSIRDLGVGLRHLSSLSLSGCGLHDLDGIGVLTGLQELNLSDNYISDITPLTFHENLQNLNLGGNKIIDIHFGSVLASCTGLRSLFLSRNPIERVSKYRVAVGFLVPGLEMLDGFPIDQHLVKKFSSTILEEVTNELKLIAEELEEEGRIESDIYDSTNPGAIISSSFSDKKVNVSLNNSFSINHNPAVSNKSSNSTNSSMNLLSSNELIPDTGSELTHGSAIVLAGNVAAAMRKRRNQSHSEKSTSSTMEEGKEFESALEVLDSALLSNSRSESNKENPASQRNSANNAHPTSSHFMKEGDITEQMLGPNSPVKRSRGSSMAAPTTTSTKAGGALELNTDFLTSPSTKPPLSSTKNDVMLGDPNTKLISATRRPQSAFTGTTYRFSEKSTPNTTTATMDNFSPRVGSASSRHHFNESGNNSAISSPRQINSSRPQSAVNPSLFENLKFSFTNGNNSSGSQSTINTARPRSGKKSTHQRDRRGIEDSEDEEDIQYNNYGDEDDEDDNLLPYQTNYKKILSVKQQQEEKVAQQKGVSSIVHLDIVKRNNATRLIFPLDYSDTTPRGGAAGEGNMSSRSGGSGSNPNNTRSNSDVEGEDSDEDIAVPHHERFRLMSAAAVRPSTSTTKTHHQILQQLKSSKSTKSVVNGIAIPDDSSSQSNEDDNEEEQQQQQQLFKKTSMSKLALNTTNTTNDKNNSMSSQIGMSLGFNLAGSLAAIDQWVQDMSSGDDEEGDEEEIVGHDGRKSKRGNQRHKEKKGAKIQIIGVPNYSNYNNSTIDSNSSKVEVPSLKDKILSRDTIINMCTNSSNPTPRTQNDMDDSMDEGRNSRSSSRKRDSSRQSSFNNDIDASFDLPNRSAIKERSAKPAISSTTKPNKLALVQKKHVTMSEDSLPSPAMVNTPDFEERLVSSVPLTSASTSALFTKKPVPSSSSTTSSTTLPITAQSMNGLESMGKGTLLSNEDIVELLKKPPKSVPMLRTKTSFQEFFKGIDRKRFEALLKEAYSDITEFEEREKKVLRRLELMDGMM